MKKLFSTLLALVLLLGIIVYAKDHTNLFRSSTAIAVGELTVDWGIGIGDVGPIFNISNMAPGQTETRNVIVTNGSTSARPVGIRLHDLTQTNALASVLNVTITEGATIVYGPVSLEQFAAESAGPEGVFLSNLPPSSSTTYLISVDFDGDSGNELQNSSASLNLTLGISVDVPAECSVFDTPSTTPIFGTAGNDTIRGTRGNDLIISLEGNDKVDGGLGDDCIVLGLGNDDGRGGNGEDVVLGDDGADKINGGNDNDTLLGGTGDDDIVGGNGADEITGNGDNDTLSGGNDSDMIDGNEGNDSIQGGNGADTLDGGADTDSINGGNGTDTCVAETKSRCEL